MNKVATSLVLVGILVAAIASADNTVNTPITEEFYSKLNEQCNSCCVRASSKVSYCSCACNTMLMNCKSVVKQYNLKYGEQLDAHYSEIFLNAKQINECKAR